MCGFWLENSGFADLFLAPAGWLCTSLRSNHSYLILRSGRRPRLEGCVHGKDSRPSFETPCYARLLRMRAFISSHAPWIRYCRCDFLAEGAWVRLPERGDGEKGFILSGKHYLCAINRE